MHETSGRLDYEQLAFLSATITVTTEDGTTALLPTRVDGQMSVDAFKQLVAEAGRAEGAEAGEAEEEDLESEEELDSMSRKELLALVKEQRRALKRSLEQGPPPASGNDASETGDSDHMEDEVEVVPRTRRRARV